MKVALVQCPSWTSESPPYTLALLAAVLKKNGHQVECFDVNIEMFQFCKKHKNSSHSDITDASWMMDFRGDVWYEKEKVLNFITQHKAYIGAIAERIIATTASIVGFSVQSTSKFFSLGLARMIKEKDPRKIIIFGGPLVFRNCYGIDILKDYPFLDAICFREAEKDFPSLLHRIEQEGKIIPHQGFGCRVVSGEIIDGRDGEEITDLNELMFADYSEFTLEKYTKNLLPIATSRGCINRCSFCSESTYWGRYRRRTAQNVCEEIIYQLQCRPSIKKFWFNDSLINGDMRMLEELCDLLLDYRIGITWGGQGMIRKEMTPELLSKMKSAGCEVISYGVESGSSKVLQLMRKYYTPELAGQVIRDTYDVGISVIFNIIVGFPGEDEQAFQETKAFVVRYSPYASHIEFPTFLLLKGSYIFSHLDEFNILPLDFNDDWQLKWKTPDNQNTYEIRRRRLEEIISLLKAS